VTNATIAARETLDSKLLALMSSNKSVSNALTSRLSPVEQLQHVSRAIEATNGVLDEEERRTALEVAKKLITSLEKPEETVMRYAWEVRFPPP